MTTPPDYMQAAASKGLEWVETGFGGDGLKQKTKDRAKLIADGADLSEDHIREMSAWFARHRSSIDGIELDEDKPSPGWVAWHLWGGDATDRAPKWADAQVEELERENEEDPDDGREDDASVADVAQPMASGYHCSMQVFHRHIRMDDAAIDDDGAIVMRASSDDAVSMGDWREVLSHEDGAIDTSTVRALLVNHNPDQIAGRIDGLECDGRACMAEAHIDKEARMQSGVNVLGAVKGGALRGVSIGYGYEREDAEWDQESRTLRVNRWRMLEVSLTPIPADKSAGVRSLPFDLDKESTPPSIGENKESRDMSEPEKKPKPAGQEAPAIDEAKVRAAAKAEAKEVVQFARSYGVDADAVIGMGMDEAKDHVLEVVKARMSEKAPEPKDPPVSVKRDAGDKFLEHASKNITRFSSEHLMRKCFELDGVDVRDMSQSDLAQRALRSMSYARDAANKTTASFSTLLGSTANKQLLSGFDRYTPIWDQFCTVKDAKDFNTHPHVGVATGRLTETAEDIAYPELNQTEGTYNSTLAKWGATISVTYEALVGDELGEIMRSFSRAGYASARTIERQVFYKLLNATWTNDVTTSAALGTAANIDKVRAGLKGKLSPAGEKMENDGAILLVDPINRYNADAATGQLYGVSTGGNDQTGSNAVRGMRVLDSTFVGDTALLAGANTTDYYLINDPMVVDTVVVEFLRGQRAPVIMEFDAGATDASKYKIRLPFQATVATHTDSAGNARITGAQKATA